MDAACVLPMMGGEKMSKAIKHTSYVSVLFVHDEQGRQYVRWSANCWFECYGSLLQPIYSFEELEAAYQALEAKQ